MEHEKLTPTDMQRADADALLEYDHGLNWSLPGTGKTMTSVCVIDQGNFDRVLVVCPKIGVSMWAEVLQTQLGMKVATMRVGTEKAWSQLEAFKYCAIVTTYAIAAGDPARRVLEPWLEDASNESIAILDEAHYCKSKDAKRSRALLSPPGKPIKVRGPDGQVHEGVRGVLGDVPGLCTKADYTLLLTGTPITRYPDDLWMQLAHVRGDVLEAYGVKSYSAFVRKFCVEKDMRLGRTGQTKRVVAGSKNEALLRQLVEDCKPIRRTLEDVMEVLPPVTERWLEVDVTLPKRVKNLKVHDLDHFIKKLNSGDAEYAEAWRELGLAKVPEAADYIKEQYDGTPVLVGFWHTDVGKALSDLLGFPVVDGSTDDKTRDRLQEQFNAGELPGLLGQIKAMGVSWNLQRKASTVVMVEVVPSRSDIDQFIARVYRRGQNKHVQVDFMSSDTGLDDALRRIVDRKQAMAKKVIG